MKDAPSLDVLEVSLIGSGYGESVIVHLGDGEWIIVDSCLERGGEDLSRSSAIAYLDEIGVDLAKRVSHVFATHWHGDHIAGLSEVVNHCESADFCCPVAFSDKEFHSFASVYADADLPKKTRSTEEIIRIMEILEERRKKPKFLITDRLVHKTSRDIKVLALSPSDERVKKFLTRIAARIPELNTQRRATENIRPNEVSVVLLIDLGDDSILLGADCEETPGNGWSAIINDCESVKGKRSSVYKVAHHGSQTAECSDIWQKLLLPSPFAILTPFNRGRKPLPGKEDVDRILGRTHHAYSAARLGSWRRTNGRDVLAERIIHETGGNIYPVPARQGHVRLRRPIGETQQEWSVRLHGDSVHLRDVWT